jgi:hypothetical protein
VSDKNHTLNLRTFGQSPWLQVESGKVDIVKDSKLFWNDMMHTLPAFLEGADRQRVQKAARHKQAAAPQTNR